MGWSAKHNAIPVKHFLAFAISVIIGFASAFAGTESVKDKSGNAVGTVDWTYSIQTYETRDGSFTTISATNNSTVYVNISFKTDAGGYESLTIAPHESKEVTIGTDKTATAAYCVGVYAK